MSSPKGFPTSKKSLSSILGYTSEQTTTNAQFTTIQDSGSDHQSLDTVQRALYRFANTQLVSTVEGKRLFKCTGIAAKKGDVIRFTSGVNEGLDFPILSAPDADTIILASEFDVAPSIGDTFDLFRWTFIQCNADGSQMVSVSSGPLTIIKDGVETQVALDTVAPYANVPLPVALTDINGSAIVNVTASGLNVKIVHNGTDPSSIRLGDGTTEVGVTANNELKTKDADALTALNSLITGVADLNTALGIQNAALSSGDCQDYTIDNVAGTTLYTGIAKKIRLVQNGGEILDIYKNAVKIGTLEAGGKMDFALPMIVTDSLIVKARSASVTTNLSWNVFN